MTVEDRLARVERWNRVLTLMVVLLLSGGVAAWRSAPPVAGRGWGTTQEDVVRTRRLEVVDAQGFVRAALTATAEGASISLLDTDGVARATLGDDAEGTALYIYDAHGDTRVGVAQFAHGGGGFALHGPEARGAAVLYLKGDGSLTFYGAEGEVAARFPGE